MGRIAGVYRLTSSWSGIRNSKPSSTISASSSIVVVIALSARQLAQRLFVLVNFDLRLAHILNVKIE